MTAEVPLASGPEGWKVLLVDDEPAVHRISRLILADLAFEGRPVELLSAASAAQAREQLARHPDVALVLQSLGGSAHQKVVVDCVAAMKRQRGEQVAQDLAAKIVEVFEKYRDLFFRPFGEGSMRWALQPGVA